MIIKKTNIAALIIDASGKLLLIKRSSLEDSMPNVWELPSGGIEKNENILTSLQREVMEETGLTINDIENKAMLVDLEKYSFETRTGNTKNVTEHTYKIVLNMTSPIIVLSKEHSDFVWSDKKDVKTYFSSEKDIIYKRLKRIFL
ncbi:MAG: NUDIX domain-containing protein [bacterium]